MRTLRILLSSLLLASVGSCLSILAFPGLTEHREVPIELAMDVLNREVAEAERLGFVVESRGESNGDGFMMQELSGAQGCVAFVFAVSGRRTTPELVLKRGREDSATDLARGTSDLNVAHAQACFEGDESVWAFPRVPGRPVDSEQWLYSESTTVHWVALTGAKDRVGGNQKLTRGYVPRDDLTP